MNSPSAKLGGISQAQDGWDKTNRENGDNGREEGISGFVVTMVDKDVRWVSVKTDLIRTVIGHKSKKCQQRSSP